MKATLNRRTLETLAVPPVLRFRRPEIIGTDAWNFIMPRGFWRLEVVQVDVTTDATPGTRYLALHLIRASLGTVWVAVGRGIADSINDYHLGFSPSTSAERVHNIGTGADCPALDVIWTEGDEFKLYWEGGNAGDVAEAAFVQFRRVGVLGIETP